MTNKPHHREDAGRLYGLAASTLYRLLSKTRFDKRSVPGCTSSTVLQQATTKTGRHEETTHSLRH